MRLHRLLLCLAAFQVFWWSTPSWADEYYLGQWVWNEPQGEEPYWEAPKKSSLTGVVDLRSIPDQSESGGTPQGWAVFSYSKTVSVSGFIYLGNDVDGIVSNPVKNQIKNKLGVEPKTETFKEILWEVLTTLADPTGQSGPKPLMPGRDRKMKLNLGAVGTIKQSQLEPFQSPEWNNVLRVVQENYKQLLRTEPPETVARVLDFWQEKYGVDYQLFIPPGEIRIAALPHNTTITENFNTSDGDTLGPDLTWTEAEGDIDIVSNTAEWQGTARSTCRAESDLSSDDHYAQIEISDTADTTTCWLGPVARFNPSETNTYYIYVSQKTSGADNGVIFKRVSGTFTQLDSNAETVSIGDTWKIESDGSNIKGYINNTEEASATDTAITGYVRSGIYGDPSSTDPVAADNFEAADLAATARRVFLVN